MQKPDGHDAKEQLDFNETKKELKKILEKLNAKEKEYVKSGVGSFVDFIASFQDDMVYALLNYKTTKSLTLAFNR